MAVPAVAPVSTPEGEILAAEEDDHKPPVEVVFKVMVLPKHTWVGPVIALGTSLTNILVVVKQPVAGIT